MFAYMGAAVSIKDAEEIVLAVAGGAGQEVRPDGYGVLHLAPGAADGGDAVPLPPPRPGPPVRCARHPPTLPALVRGHGHFDPGAAPGKRRGGRRRGRLQLGLFPADLGHARASGGDRNNDAMPRGGAMPPQQRRAR
jgi:hypothetical protein